MMSFLKKMGVFAYFLLIWVFPLVKHHENYMLIFIISCIVSFIFQLFIKNRNLAFLASVVAFIPAILFNKEYIFFIVSPTLVLNEYLDIFKRKSKNKNEHKHGIISASTNLSVFVGIAVLIYLYFSSARSSAINCFYYYKSQNIIWALFFIYILLVSISLTKKLSWKQISAKYRIDVALLERIRFIHLLNMICFIETMIMFYFINCQTFEYEERAYFLPWFIYLGAMFYFNDPICEILLNRMESVFGKIAAKVKLKIFY